MNSVELDRGQVKRVEDELARHIGPIAAFVVAGAAKTASSIAALAQSVSAEIGDGKARAVFLRKFSASSSASGLVEPPASVPKEVKEVNISQKFTADTLQKAEEELAEYMGAIAKVIVKRAAAKARYEGELYRLIADETTDPVGRALFIRKAARASAKR